MIHTAIVFDHRGRTGKGKEGPLELRVTIDRKINYISTGVRVRKDEWKFGSIVDRPDAQELNERLAIISKAIEQAINNCLREQRPIDVAELRHKAEMRRDDIDNASFLNWLSQQIQNLPLAIGTIKHYRTLETRLEQFGKIRKWQDITVENVVQFDNWLHKQSKQLSDNQIKSGIAGGTLSDATIHNYHKNLKKMLGLAEKFGKIERNPYARLRGEFVRGERETIEYLTEPEMDSIRQLQLEPGSQLAAARDMFVAQMFTGMSYTDLCKFDIENYKKVDGSWATIDERVKTGVAYVGHLLPPVVEVLERYGMQMPKMCNQDYNRMLKKIGELSGIKTRLHSHLARHTFGTYMLANGVKIENLQRMMGHKNIAMTQRYAKTLAASVHEDFDMIAEKIKTAQGN